MDVSLVLVFIVAYGSKDFKYYIMMHNAYWSYLPDLFTGNEYGLPQRRFQNGQIRFMSLAIAEVVSGAGLIRLAESEACKPYITGVITTRDCVINYFFLFLAK